MNSDLTAVRELKRQGNPEAARLQGRFFKSGPGQYGEGDRFLGLNAAKVQAVVKDHQDLTLPQISKLMKSPLHEVRMCGVCILGDQMRKLLRAKSPKTAGHAKFYLAHKKHVNNWDLVDASAANVLGAYLLTRPKTERKKLLSQLAKSKTLWDRRIAMVATLAFIRAQDFSETFRLATLLKKDSEDLMHKAAGWMLREAGKRDQKALEKYLEAHASTLPRTALRYSIERFTPARRQYFMKL